MDAFTVNGTSPRHCQIMSKRMKKCSGDLKYLGACSPKTRKLILKGANSDLIKSIAEAAWTVLSSEVKLTPAQRKRRVKDESILRNLAPKQRNLSEKF